MFSIIFNGPGRPIVVLSCQRGSSMMRATWAFFFVILFSRPSAVLLQYPDCLLCRQASDELDCPDL